MREISLLSARCGAPVVLQYYRTLCTSRESVGIDPEIEFAVVPGSIDLSPEFRKKMCLGTALSRECFVLI